MALLPSVKIIEEGSGTVLLNCDGFMTTPKQDERIVLSVNGGTQTEYKVESVKYVIDSVEHLDLGGQVHSVSVNGVCEVTVSVV